MNNFLHLVHCQTPIHTSKLCLKTTSSVRFSLSPGLIYSTTELSLISQVLQSKGPPFPFMFKEPWAETIGRPAICPVSLPGVFLRTSSSSGPRHPAQLLLLSLQLGAMHSWSHLCLSCHLFSPHCSFFPCSTATSQSMGSSVTLQSMYRTRNKLF